MIAKIEKLTKLERDTLEVLRDFAEEGFKIKFEGEQQRYTIQAFDGRYAICTKPMNALKTKLYTILDFDEGIRGTENLIFCMGFETKELCNEALIRLQTGESEISYRNRIKLDIISISKN